MPQLNRMYCSNCKNSIYNTMVDGVRIPLVFYFVVGQPSDTGPQLDVNAPGVKVPSFVRELMQPHVPVARAELCIKCVAEIFGTELVTAVDDPMHSIEQVQETSAAVRAVVENAEIDEVTTNATVLERPLLAIKVGRGAQAAPALPAEKAKALPLPPAQKNGRASVSS